MLFYFSLLFFFPWNPKVSSAFNLSKIPSSLVFISLSLFGGFIFDKNNKKNSDLISASIWLFKKITENETIFCLNTTPRGMCDNYFYSGFTLPLAHTIINLLSKDERENWKSRNLYFCFLQNLCCYLASSYLLSKIMLRSASLMF